MVLLLETVCGRGIVRDHYKQHRHCTAIPYTCFPVSPAALVPLTQNCPRIPALRCLPAAQQLVAGNGGRGKGEGVRVIGLVMWEKEGR